jgi:tripeptidyl-peptidase-2
MHFPPPDKLPKGLEVGDVLTGSVDYEGKDSNAKGAGSRPGGWPVSYVVPPPAAEQKKDKPAVSEVKDERSEVDKMAEERRDWEVKRLEKLTSEAEKFAPVYAVLIAAYPGHLPLLQANLKHLDSSTASPNPNLAALIAACDEVVGLVDQGALAAWGGLKHDLTDGTVVKEKKAMDVQKSALTDALGRKARALINFEDAKEGDFEGALKELKKWVKIEGDDKYAVLELEIAKKAGRFGSMLAIIDKLGDGDGTKGGLKEYTKEALLGLKSEVQGWCGWNELVEYSASWKLLNGMKAFALA